MKTKTLAELRVEKNISQRSLAEAIGTAPSSIGMYETGLRTPPLEKARKIAKFFGVLVDEIEFGGYKSPRGC